MQTLTVVARLFPQILSGEKRATIRWKEAPITVGPMLYVCAGDLSKRAVVEVVRVTDMPLSQAAAYLGREDEWPKPVMLAGMREHYPQIGWDDMVQVIEHIPMNEGER